MRFKVLRPPLFLSGIICRLGSFFRNRAFLIFPVFFPTGGYAPGIELGQDLFPGTGKGFPFFAQQSGDPCFFLRSLSGLLFQFCLIGFFAFFHPDLLFSGNIGTPLGPGRPDI